MLAACRLLHLLMHMEPVNYNTDFAFRQQFDTFRSHSKQTVTTSDLSFHSKCEAAYTITLKMEKAGLSETLVPIYQTIRSHTAEELSLYPAERT